MMREPDFVAVYIPIVLLQLLKKYFFKYLIFNAR